MPLWASWLKDFDILNIFYDELKIEKMAKFEILIATNGLRSRASNAGWAWQVLMGPGIPRHDSFSFSFLLILPDKNSVSIS